MNWQWLLTGDRIRASADASPNNDTPSLWSKFNVGFSCTFSLMFIAIELVTPFHFILWSVLWNCVWFFVTNAIWFCVHVQSKSVVWCRPDSLFAFSLSCQWAATKHLCVIDRSSSAFSIVVVFAVAVAAAADDTLTQPNNKRMQKNACQTILGQK